MALKKTLTIAGSDTSAGAGMQADLKTFQELGTYGIVALTSIVTMDKKSWSHDVTPIPFRKTIRNGDFHWSRCSENRYARYTRNH